MGDRAQDGEPRRPNRQMAPAENERREHTHANGDGDPRQSEETEREIAGSRQR